MCYILVYTLNIVLKISQHKKSKILSKITYKVEWFPEIGPRYKTVAAILKIFMTQQSGTVIITANKMVINWLTNHMKVMDKKIGDYVNINRGCRQTMPF